MKRYIKSTQANADGYREYLRSLGELSDSEIDTWVANAFPDNRSEEVLLTPELEHKIYSEFSRADANEICNLIECGYSVDNAIQTVLFRG